LLCDIDHFKQVNDVHGHLVGDEILRQVATRLRNSVRSFDAVGRYGGEEFLILLKGCGGAHLGDRAERVRDAVARRPFLIESLSLPISLSLGALDVSGWDTARSVEFPLNAVDAALYLAKSAGRNRVVCADPLLAAAR
jgi:diguanylate cyclase (GGDEF)-like protein